MIIQALDFSSLTEIIKCKEEKRLNLQFYIQ